MAGQIHGIIDRGQAWKMWEPYGKRVELDGDMNPDSIDHADALRILWGTSGADRSKLYGFWYDENDTRQWYEGLRDINLKDNPEFVNVLSASHAKQQKNAERKRLRELEAQLGFVQKIGAATARLVRGGIFTPAHKEQIDSWLIGPDGNPFMQYTPMSQFEAGRLARRYGGGTDEGLVGQDSADFNLGIIRSGIVASKGSRRTREHNRVHECVHAGMSGLELYDITRVDGVRWPEATIIGIYQSDPTTAVVAGYDFSGDRHMEPLEGWTDYIARLLMDADPNLGQPPNKSAYDGWVKTTAKLHTDHPSVFRALTDAIMVEASPSRPTAKTDAIDALMTFADKVLGETGALDKLYQTTGGSITDTFRRSHDT